MDPWSDVRLRARELRAHLLAVSTNTGEVFDPIAAAILAEDIEVCHASRIRLGHGVKGRLYRHARLIIVLDELGQTEQNFVLAHELGHYYLHAGQTQSFEVDRSASVPSLPTAGGYSPAERRELQADLFASEFLCPSDWLLTALQTRRPREIAEELKVPHTLVLEQTARALLLPALISSEAPPTPMEPYLDAEQARAAKWTGSSFWLEGAAGTGKTRTLIGRAIHLIDTGVDPSSILILTGSDRVTEALRERFGRSYPGATIQIWLGTFQAFGREIISRWPTCINRTSRLQVLDRVASIDFVEQAFLEAGPLKFSGQSVSAGQVFRLISQCKAALIEPDDVIGGKPRCLAGRKPEEIDKFGSIYKCYEQNLQKTDAVDYGDLLSKALKILDAVTEVKEALGHFKHVLVDDAQNLSAVCYSLLAALGTCSAHLWITGDFYQMLSAFRGVSPADSEILTKKVTLTRQRLNHNYRSVRPLAQRLDNYWSTLPRKHTGLNLAKAAKAVVSKVTERSDKEAQVISCHIEEARRAGIPYKQQVILARSHEKLNEITSSLMKYNIPIKSLSDFCTIQHVENLLALLSLDDRSAAETFMTVAQMPCYGLSKGVVANIVSNASTNGQTIHETLAAFDETERLDQSSKQIVHRLVLDLTDLPPGTPPWTFLATWLFERSDYLKMLRERSSLEDRKARAAIYHLLEICREQEKLGDTSRSQLNARIRSVGALDQDTNFRKLWADDADAVSVMTIHASEGLEFDAVYLSGVTERSFKGSDGVKSGSEAMVRYGANPDEEEHRLLYVALSRARQKWFLSLRQRRGAASFTYPRPFAGLSPL